MLIFATENVHFVVEDNRTRLVYFCISGEAEVHFDMATVWINRERLVFTVESIKCQHTIPLKLIKVIMGDYLPLSFISLKNLEFSVLFYIKYVSSLDIFEKDLFQKLENSNYTSTAKNSAVIEEVLRNILIKKREKNLTPTRCKINFFPKNAKNHTFADKFSSYKYFYK